MGQLAIALHNPQRRKAIRDEGGQFEYENPTPLLEDLIATRRVWSDVTILSNDIPTHRVYGFIAFWEVVNPGLDFILPYDVVMGCRDHQARDLFLQRQSEVLNFVEKEAAKTSFTADEPDVRVSFWTRLMQDDDIL